MSKKILIVEDERLLQKALRDALTDRGYDIEAVGSAEEAEPYLDAASGFDLVVLDHRLPGRSGLDVLRRIRESELPARVLVMTAYGTNGLEGELKELAADRFVKKPFDLENFLDVVADLVGNGGS